MSTSENVGYFVVTPLQLSQRPHQRILVNRGWVPKHGQHEGRPEGEVEFIGVVRKTEQRTQFSPKNSPESNMWKSPSLKYRSCKA